jgi:hypothetical protein
MSFIVVVVAIAVFILALAALWAEFLGRIR